MLVPFIVWERHSRLLAGDSESKLDSVEKSSKTTLEATWLCHSGKMSGTPVLRRAVTTTPIVAVKKKATVLLLRQTKTLSLHILSVLCLNIDVFFFENCGGESESL